MMVEGYVFFRQMRVLVKVNKGGMRLETRSFDKDPKVVSTGEEKVLGKHK